MAGDEEGRGVDGMAISATRGVCLRSDYSSVSSVMVGIFLTGSSCITLSMIYFAADSISGNNDPRLKPNLSSCFLMLNFFSDGILTLTISMSSELSKFSLRPNIKKAPFCAIILRLVSFGLTASGPFRSLRTILFLKYGFSDFINCTNRSVDGHSFNE